MSWEKIYTHPEFSFSSPTFEPNSGDLYLAVQNGDILRISDRKDSHPEIASRTQGQPQGLAFDPSGRLLICDLAHQAIMYANEDGEAAPLVSDYEDKAFKGPSSVCLDSNHVVYFTDSGHFGETTLQSPKGSLFAVVGNALQPLAYECLAHPCSVAACALPSASGASASSECVYVCEMMQNRILRFIQHPKGVYHATVFYQFSGGVGPSSVVCDGHGNLFVARYNFPATGSGIISILTSDGHLLKEIMTPAPQVNGITLAHFADSAYIYITESSTRSVYRISVNAAIQS
eukprot:TRINITY_DN6855_c0_g1_i2.p1 TRINITY_DN6855_c0_g1~~TRINITY_DN6855_c0_g1_i2.p1  ORF type:complete len:289 (-),score=41.71 TRINITY_DN6855_c0_g1_i2:66-932(-)